jgi:hypothetical protein
MNDASRYSRRRFLGAVGAGAGAVALAPRNVVAEIDTSPASRARPEIRPDRFGRIFRLPPFAPPSPKVEAALRELGARGGLLDAQDPLEAGPEALIVDPKLSANNPNNPTQTAGTTFFGQFLDHDITFDTDSRLGEPTPPENARNARTPAFDLDSVYGAGPVADQHLYEPGDRARLRVESGGLFEDVPRRADGTAIVADPRNDEHLILSELVIPVEFQAGAYRMGHSMVRPSYRANLADDQGQPFFAFIFDPAQEGKPDPDDLRGGVRAPRRFVGWQTFFDFGDGGVKPNKKIDTRISSALFNLPLGAIASHDPPTALPQRTLLRHLTWQLPSGQSVARAIGVRPLGPAEVSALKSLGVGFERSTPLWYYVLREAELYADGLHLGPVGGRIVAEVFVGLLQTDPGSYLSLRPGWQPELPSEHETFRTSDFLAFAGVDPCSRGQ